MTSTDENTPIKKTGKNGKSDPQAKKTAKRSRKPAQAAPEPVHVEQPLEPITVAAAVIENPTDDTVPEVAAAPAPDVFAATTADVSAPAVPDVAVPTTPDVSAPAAPDVSAPALPAVFAITAPAGPTESAPVNLQTITNAYGDFTRKSIEQTSFFFEQLAGVRSLAKAFELQGEFVRQLFETFLLESRKIRELHSEMTMQRLHNLESFVARMMPTRS